MNTNDDFTEAELEGAAMAYDALSAILDTHGTIPPGTPLLPALTDAEQTAGIPLASVTLPTPGRTRLPAVDILPPRPRRRRSLLARVLRPRRGGAS